MPCRSEEVIVIGTRSPAVLLHLDLPCAMEDRKGRLHAQLPEAMVTEKKPDNDRKHSHAYMKEAAGESLAKSRQSELFLIPTVPQILLCLTQEHCGQQHIQLKSDFDAFLPSCIVDEAHYDHIRTLYKLLWSPDDTTGCTRLSIWHTTIPVVFSVAALRLHSRRRRRLVLARRVVPAVAHRASPSGPSIHLLPFGLRR
jgi:hypothetical protein